MTEIQKYILNQMLSALPTSSPTDAQRHIINSMSVMLEEITAAEQINEAELLPRCGMCGEVATISHHYCDKHNP